MRILLYSISYSPEMAGSGRFNGEMAAWLAKQGHKVDVITAHPYYPEWRVWQNYRGKGWFSEEIENVRVYRTPLYVPRNVTGTGRILHELSFVAASLLHWFRILFRKYSIVIGVCPPMQIGIIPYLFCKIRNIPFCFHVQDLQVDAARELGMIKNGALLSILDKIERFLLRNATLVSSISDGMKRKILDKGVSPEKYVMLPNWADLDFLRPLPPSQKIRDGLAIGVSDKVILYSGNIGEKQGIDVIIETAHKLQTDLIRNVKFVISGEGAALKSLMEKAQSLGLDNVIFAPIRPYAELPELLSIADVHLVVQKKAASDLVMPSKFVSILAVGGVAIVSAESDSTLGRMVTENRIGWLTEPENPVALADTIVKALNCADTMIYKNNARQFAEQNLGRDALLSQFEQILTEHIQN